MKKTKKKPKAKFDVSWTWILEHELPNVSKLGPIFVGKKSARAALSKNGNLVENRDGVLIPMIKINSIRLMTEASLAAKYIVNGMEHEHEILRQALETRVNTAVRYSVPTHTDEETANREVSTKDWK